MAGKCFCGKWRENVFVGNGGKVFLWKAEQILTKKLLLSRAATI
jgi:hypothetical protein